MKMVTAFIQPPRLEHVREALINANIIGMTITTCCGHGREPPPVDRMNGLSNADLMPAIMVEVIAPAARCAEAVTLIIQAARIGERDAGKIFISNLDRVISIRTGLDDLETAIEARPRASSPISRPQDGTHYI